MTLPHAHVTVPSMSEKMRLYPDLTTCIVQQSFWERKRELLTLYKGPVAVFFFLRQLFGEDTYQHVSLTDSGGQFNIFY
jgi:hypothetical protein